MKKYIKIIIVLIIIFSLSQIFNMAFAITDIEDEAIVEEKNEGEEEVPTIDDTNEQDEIDQAEENDKTDEIDETVETVEVEETDEVDETEAAEEKDETIMQSETSDNEEIDTNIPTYTKTIEEGIYTIKTAINENFVFDIYGSSKENKANLELYTNNLKEHQKFKLEYLGDGSYSISPVHSNKNIDVEGDSKIKGTNISQWQKTNSENQRWYIKDLGNGYYNIISKSSGLYIDIPAGDAKNGANVQVWTENGAKNQMFKFEESENKTIKDGVYTIKTAINENFVFDIYGSSKENKANLELYTNNLKEHQKFKLEYLGDGSYSISPVHSNKNIDVEGDSKIKGTNISQWQKTNSENQRWYIKDLGNGYYNIISKSSGLYIDIPAGDAKNGANVQVWTGNGAKNQMFKFEESKNKTIENGTYSIRNVSDYNVIDVSGASISNSANITTWSNSSKDHQKFKLNYTTDGYYTISATHSGKYLDVKGASTKSGTNVIQYNSTGKDNQKWTLKSLGNGYYNIISKLSGLYLTASSGNICVMTANNSNNQKFQFYNPSSLATFSTGTYGKSGLKVKGDKRGTDLKYYKYGTGSNVFFATFCLHGFEDAWKKDGGELVKIADAFYEKLKVNNDMSLANKWTIYIFPEVNPDGRNYGTTNNGPGRTTLYSADSKHKGIDLNRCWSTSFSAITNNDRNYTGKTSFLAYEARYLRDFLLANKSKNGQTLLVDLHGWTQQLIGDATIRGYYKKYFPENEDTPTYGKGYMINWARTNLGSSAKTAKSALIELPSYIRSASDVTKYGLKDKYINATLNMLKGII